MNIDWGKVYKIGIVGYSAQQKIVENNFETITNIFRREFDEIERKHSKNYENFAIVSGLTAIGVPKISYEIGSKRSYHTVGIACSRANKYPCFKVTKKIIVGNNWGDESSCFINFIDILIRVGGGKQSRKEVEMAKKRKMQIVEYDLDEG